MANEKSIDKPTIFIASSGKSKGIAEAIKLNFDRETDVDIGLKTSFSLTKALLKH